MLKKSNYKSSFLNSPAFMLILVYAIMVLIFSLTTENYFTIKNFQGIFLTLAIEGFVVVGVAFVIIGGNFDLSVGSIVGLISVLVVLFFKMDLPIYLVVFICLISGALMGFINGIIVKVIGINSIITTLGTNAIFLGAAYLVNVFIKKEIVVNESFNNFARVYFGGRLPAVFLYP